MDKLANANSQFALDLFQKLTEAHPTGNVFFSPLSLSSALAMVALGARGNTASELLKVKSQSCYLKDPSMKRKEECEEKLPIGYIPECKCYVLELPYKGEDLSMIILLPDSIEDNSTGLEQLEQQLTLEKLQEWTQPKNMNSSVDVNVHLPKFQLEENYDLKSYFAALGLVDVFDGDKADLSGMSGAQDLHVSKIVHKSFLEVNEAGTEAAAATAAKYVPCCLVMGKDFNADHPFLFYIRHNPTNTILFLGRFASP
ncbi:leukocyte elastase inhibitor-like [Pituophis catenifer annectens]|uniref:leukocyte elastase inhibitor-like n=1 Tax=Pituophis catenifer annectens TaxID=94852 RepID=UPI003995F32D